MDYNVKKNSINLGVMLSIICFITNISQIPSLHGNKIIKVLVSGGWIVLFIYILLKFYKKLNINIFLILIPTFGFNLFILISQFLLQRNYIKSNFFYPVNLCVFVFITSYFIGQFILKESIHRVIDSYFISCLIVCLIIYLEYFVGVEWSNSKTYVYGAKNSIGQIALIGIMSQLIFNKSKLNKLIRYFGILFLTLFIFMIKSRATLVGFLFSFILFIFFGITRKKYKFIVVVLSLITVLTIFINNELYELVINNILLNNRQGTDLNTISSGRIDHIYIFLKDFWNYPLFGWGGRYLESFPLAVLISYGIVGSLFLFILAASPIYYVFKRYQSAEHRDIKITIIVLIIIFFINSIFEELPPFGPGVKSYTLWMFTGLYVGLRKQNNK